MGLTDEKLQIQYDAVSNSIRSSAKIVFELRDELKSLGVHSFNIERLVESVATIAQEHNIFGHKIMDLNK